MNLEFFTVTVGLLPRYIIFILLIVISVFFLFVLFWFFFLFFSLLNYSGKVFCGKILMIIIETIKIKSKSLHTKMV